MPAPPQVPRRCCTGWLPERKRLATARRPNQGSMQKSPRRRVNMPQLETGLLQSTGVVHAERNSPSLCHGGNEGGGRALGGERSRNARRRSRRNSSLSVSCWMESFRSFHGKSSVVHACMRDCFQWRCLCAYAQDEIPESRTRVCGERKSVSECSCRGAKWERARVTRRWCEALGDGGS